MLNMLKTINPHTRLFTIRLSLVNHYFEILIAPLYTSFCSGVMDLPDDIETGEITHTWQSMTFYHKGLINPLSWLVTRPYSLTKDSIRS